MILLVDAGNTRIKWVLWNDGQFVRRGHVLHRGSDRALLGEQLWGTLERPAQVVIASVAGTELVGTLNRWISETWAVPVHCAVSEAAGFGITNAYAVPAQMGADRWVGMIGARNRIARASCVVDCGTAITIDALSATGVHRGGVIFPGIRLMRESLYRDTRQIPEEHNGQVVLFGASTRDCVWGGTVHAVATAIDGITGRMREELGEESLCLLTGGDAETLLPYLRGCYRLEPDLIFHGLLVIAGQA